MGVDVDLTNAASIAATRDLAISPNESSSRHRYARLADLARQREAMARVEVVSRDLSSHAERQAQALRQSYDYQLPTQHPRQ